LSATAALDWETAAAWRMRRHRLAGRAPRDEAVAVAGAVLGLHAQVMTSAELTLWARVDGLAREDVSRLLWEERRLVKTWAMRGTLHLLPSTELPLWLGALGTYRHFLTPSWSRAFGVPVGGVDGFVAAVGQALDGPPLSRAELAQAVARIAGDDELGARIGESSWGSILKPAAYRGRLVFAPSAGQAVRFTRPDRWLGALAPAPPGDEALAEVARRFLAAHAPATRDDLARWWGVSPAQAGKAVARLGAAVATVAVDGAPAWMLATDVADAARAEPAGAVRLVPAFDQYVVGATRHAERLLPPGDVRDRVYRAQGWLSPVLLVDGRMEGVWRHERRGARLAVHVEPFRAQPAWVREAGEREAQRLAAFLGGALSLEWA
jgi:hypothetical protein